MLALVNKCYELKCSLSSMNVDMIAATDIQ